MKKLAMYLRLSVGDEGDKDESNSIGNQRKQIYEYIHRDSELWRCEVTEFCDDGCSGTNMERPGMQKMLNEVRRGNIQCIIVKDMSRFSRDYIEMGTYLNQIFPFMGVRFISINDCYDSRGQQGNTIELDTAFRTLLYDLYSKDVSVKVKAALENKHASGEYVSGQVPFGYRKSMEVKNAVAVNEAEAAVVRRIFSLAMQGKSSTQIARQLHGEGVPAIMEMRKPDKEYADGKIYSWSANSVRRILNNRFYLGEMAYGKSVRRSVGGRDSIAVPKEAWRVICNHHEALIPEKVFEQVSSFRPEASAKRNRGKHPLTGKLYCGGCGYSMNYKPLRGKNRYRRFECGKHALLKIPECCTYMNAASLEEAVLSMLNKELLLMCDVMRQRESLIVLQKRTVTFLEKRLEGHRLEIKRAEAKKDMYYENYALGDISEEEYRKKAGMLTEQISLLSVKAEETASKLAVQESRYCGPEADTEQIIRYLHIEELTQAAADLFIRKIYVCKNKRIEIEWSFGRSCGISQKKET